MAVSAKPPAGAPEEQGEQRFKTLSGEPIRALYRARGPAGRASAARRTRSATPAPTRYTRGIQKTMYRGRLWTMRQFAGFGTSEETNERFR